MNPILKDGDFFSIKININIMDKKYIVLIISLLIVFAIVGFIVQSIVQSDKGSKPSATISQNFDSNEKLLVVGENFDITLTIESAVPAFMKESILLGMLFDKIHSSKYESPFDGNMLNFNDNFEIISVSNDWEMEKITSNTNYKIVDYFDNDYRVVYEKGLYEKGLLFINNKSSDNEKILTLSLKAKQKGRYGLVMSQMQSETGFINLCVGDTIEEARELCQEIKPTSTRLQAE